jgi:hypothetical protein
VCGAGSRYSDPSSTCLYALECVERLSEKGYKQRSEGGLGRYEEVEMGRKEPAGRSVGLCHGHLQDFSDSLERGILRSSDSLYCIDLPLKAARMV